MNQNQSVTWVDAISVVGQLHVGGVCAHHAHVRICAHRVVGHVLQLLLVVGGQVLRILQLLDFFDWWKLHKHRWLTVIDFLLTARHISSSLLRVLLPFRYSPLIISFNSGNFLVGKTFFLSTDLPFAF